VTPFFMLFFLPKTSLTHVLTQSKIKDPPRFVRRYNFDQHQDGPEEGATNRTRESHGGLERMIAPMREGGSSRKSSPTPLDIFFSLFAPPLMTSFQEARHA